MTRGKTGRLFFQAIEVEKRGRLADSMPKVPPKKKIKEGRFSGAEVGENRALSLGKLSAKGLLPKDPPGKLVTQT